MSQIECRIYFDVSLLPKTPINTAERIRLNQAEVWLESKIYRKIRELEDEINFNLQKEQFIKPEDLIKCE